MLKHNGYCFSGAKAHFFAIVEHALASEFTETDGFSLCPTNAIGTLQQSRINLFSTIFVLLSLLFVIYFPIKAQSLQLAEEAYQNGNYRAAIDLYELALLEGEIKGEVYFNLGNAYYLDRQFGKAMQNYRRAEFYLPRNSAIDSQMALIRAQRVDGMLTEVDWVVVMNNLTADTLTLTETTAIVFVIWLLFFLVLAIGLRRKGWVVPISVLGVAMIIAVGVLVTRVYVETQRPAGVVITEQAQAMSGPADSYLPLFVLYEALELRVLDERNGWLRFALPDGRQGWIRASNVGYIPNRLG